MKNIYLIFICFTLACEGNSNKSIEHKSDVVNLKTNSYTKLKVHDIIHLKDTENNTLADPTTISFLENKIIVLDKYRNNSVFIYDENGYQENVIYNPGEGPGQYTNIESIRINKKNITIDIATMDLGKIISYDLSGKFVSEWFYKADENLAGSSISQFYSTGIYDIYMLNPLSNQKFNLKVHNKRTNDFARYFPIDEYDMNEENRNSISILNDSIIYAVVGARNTIFEINLNSNTITSQYIVDFGENTFILDDFKKSKRTLSDYLNKENQDMNFGLINLFQNESHIAITTASFKRKLHSYIIDKSSLKNFDLSAISEKYFFNSRMEDVIGIKDNRYFVAKLKINDLNNSWGPKDISSDLKLKIAKMEIKDIEDVVIVYFSIVD